MQRAANRREPMNLEPSYELHLFTAESHAIAEYDIKARTRFRESTGFEVSVANCVQMREELIISIFSPHSR
ncbi:hypothetical protein TNCV_4333571 [Trichonephila clavipes]|nr:hypothetical protein TNCV_4333571 [Trichonephila clavipes]